eukprot:GHVH01014199.1.p2 GENE.GHVH01014199.1~~GHVH01014199.1.p2  ORF type:complete len:125 (+),score=25.17 GHVH01014199.1:672-1046(+)
MVPPDEAEWLAIYQMISSTLCAALKFKVIIDDEAALLLKDTHGGDIRASITDEISTRFSSAGENRQDVNSEKRTCEGCIVPHYDHRYVLVSAFQKSIRASDRDADIYYLFFASKWSLLLRIEIH